jgi:hypothetical protein
MMPARVGEIKEDHQKLKDLRILVDRDRADPDRQLAHRPRDRPRPRGRVEPVRAGRPIDELEDEDRRRRGGVDRKHGGRCDCTVDRNIVRAPDKLSLVEQEIKRIVQA